MSTLSMGQSMCHMASSKCLHWRHCGVCLHVLGVGGDCGLSKQGPKADDESLQLGWSNL